MSRITICGLVNLETTVPVDNFPVEYCPIDYKFFGITTHPSGVGLNLSSALKSLGDSLFAYFLHFYAKTKDPRYSLRLATVFASYKIGDTSACRGFLDEASLIKLSEEIGD